MRIEKVQISDAEKLLEIYAPYVINTAISFEHKVPSAEEFKERIKTISSKYPYIKAMDEDGVILGYAYAGAFKTREAYNWAVETTVYVDKNRKGEGIGRALYESLEKTLSSMGILNVNACIAYAEKEDEHLTNDSFHFHEHMGYTLVGTFHKCGYKFNTWYNMIWMEKMLGEHIEKQPEVRFGDWTL